MEIYWTRDFLESCEGYRTEPFKKKKVIKSYKKDMHNAITIRKKKTGE